jgi:RNA polymerase sigma-70 factor (ECF subfamily)
MTEKSQPSGLVDVRQDVIDGYAARHIRRRAWQLARKVGYTLSDLEDIEQELKQHLLQRLDQFDPAKSRWRTFVVLVVDRRVVHLIDRALAGCRFPKAISLQSRVDESERKGIELGDTLSKRHDRRRSSTSDEIERLQLRLDLDTVVSKLSRTDRDICQELSMASLSESARRLNVPRTTLGDRRNKLQKLFIEHDLNAYL